MSKESNNVIAFPKANPRINNAVEMAEFIRNDREQMADMVSNDIAATVLLQLSSLGFMLNSDCTKDVILIRESIKSLLLKTIGSFSPIQDIADDFVTIVDEETNDYVINELFCTIVDDGDDFESY